MAKHIEVVTKNLPQRFTIQSKERVARQAICMGGLSESGPGHVDLRRSLRLNSFHQLKIP